MVTTSYCTPHKYCVSVTATGRHADQLTNAIVFVIAIGIIGGAAYLLTRG